jgi:hypothetical protein
MLEYTTQQSAVQSALQQVAAPEENTTVQQPLVPADSAAPEALSQPAQPGPVWAERVKSLFVSYNGKIMWGNILAVMVLVIMVLVMWR